MIRRRLVLAILATIAATSVLAAADVVIADWQDVPVGHHGVPPGWTPYETFGGHPAYDFSVVVDTNHRALSLASHGDHSTIAKRIAVDLAQTPILRWSWKVTQLPTGGDVRRKETSDLTGHLFVIWPRKPEFLLSRLIGYAWDATAPAGSVVRSRKTGTVTFIIVRSGPRDLGRWLTEQRNVAADYRMVYGEGPKNPSVLALSIDSNDTHTSAAALIGEIRFTSSALSRS